VKETDDTFFDNIMRRKGYTWFYLILFLQELEHQYLLLIENCPEKQKHNLNHDTELYKDCGTLSLPYEFTETFFCRKKYYY